MNDEHPVVPDDQSTVNPDDEIETELDEELDDPDDEIGTVVDEELDEELDDPDEALYDAVQDNDLAKARRALEAGADPNYCPHNWPVLMDAANEGFSEMVQLLLDAGADPNAEDTTCCKGESALSLAQSAGHHDIAAMLIDAGADTSARGDDMMSAFTRAVMSGDYELADTLDGDIDDSGDDPLDRTPLEIALEEGDIDAVKYLLDRANIAYDPDELGEMSDEDILRLAGQGPR